MNNYLNIMTSYYHSLNKIASNVDGDLVEGISHKLLKNNASLSEFNLEKKCKKIITLAILEEFYDDANVNSENETLINELGVSLAASVASSFSGQEVKIVTAKGKYDHINFKPPESVANAAERGLSARRKAPKSQKGGLSPQEAKKQGIGSGVTRAVNLKNRNKLSPGTIKRMKAFFSRHEKNKKIDKGKTRGSDKGYQAWLLWGGDPGKSWANKVVRQMEAADRKSKKGRHLRSK